MSENVIERMERIDAKRKISDFMVKEKQPYEFKKRYAEIRSREFVRECNARDLNYHVSVGGLDSIVLFVFLHSIGIDAPGISVSAIENKSNRMVHSALGIERLPSAKKVDGTIWNKVDILREFGFPVLSKEIAGKIEVLQHPTDRNKTVRHAIITGETGAFGGFQKNSRMKMSQKWLEKFGGYENETEGVNYKKPDFFVSSKCCYYLKEKPCDDWAKEHNSVPFLGLMASEGGRRAKSLRINGCNYFGKSTIRSAPFAIFNRQDLLQLALEMDEWYQEHYNEFSGEKIDSIIPTVYGEIKPDEEGLLQTTGAQRTGCDICGFGIHLERRPHRFDMLRKQNSRIWDFYMNRICTDENGNQYGWGKVLDYIGVSWRDEIESD